MLALSLELGFRGIHFFRERSKPEYPELALTPYSGKPWAKDLFREFDRLQNEFEPFIEWRKKEFHGKTIHVEADGSRKTWNPAPGAKPQLIFVFGGSTLWGSGARDEFTIPSFLSKKLNQTGRHVFVQNFGETAYTFLQEIIRLALLLKEGKRPDYVLFYDGVNDVYAGYQAGQAVALQNLSFLREKLKADPSLYVWLSRWLMRNSFLYRDLEALVHKIVPEKVHKEKAASFSDEQLYRLAEEIANEYGQSTGLLDKLAEAYQFKYLIFWQPVIFLENRSTEEEEQRNFYRDDAAIRKLYRAAGEKINRKKFPHFFDVSSVLKNRPHTLYIDFCHLSEEGNEIVASRISEIFKQELGRQG